MKLSHAGLCASVVFDEPNLVSLGGLAPLVKLAEDAGLRELADDYLSVPTDRGANAGLKVMSLVAGMVAGADSRTCTLPTGCSTRRPRSTPTGCAGWPRSRACGLLRRRGAGDRTGHRTPTRQTPGRNARRSGGGRRRNLSSGPPARRTGEYRITELTDGASKSDLTWRSRGVGRYCSVTSLSLARTTQPETSVDKERRRMALEYSLFNSADDCLAHSLKGGVFEESLILNLLFQERLLMHEAYFFNSTLLVEHIEQAQGRPALFEVAAKAGLIVPAFRDPKTESLDHAFEKMKSEYGQDFVLLHPKVQPFKNRIVAAVDIGLERQKPFYWPANAPPLGEGYEAVLRNMLQTDRPPDYALFSADREQLLNRVWAASERWRFEGIADAAARTVAKGAKGLQRAELFCSIGWSLGISRDEVTIKPLDIVTRCGDLEQRLAMEVFLKWISQCYHLNQAQSFHTAINFPVYNLDEDFIVDSLLRSPLDAAPATFEGFRCEVELPPLNVLLSADAADLIRIRDDLGSGYLYALKKWQRNPTGENQEATQASLRDYCAQICRSYDQGIRQKFVASMTQGTSSSPWGDLGRAAASGLGLATGTPLGVFSQMTKTLSTVYRYFRRRRVNAGVASSDRDLEITLPV